MKFKFKAMSKEPIKVYYGMYIELDENQVNSEKYKWIKPFEINIDFKNKKKYGCGWIADFCKEGILMWIESFKLVVFFCKKEQVLDKNWFNKAWFSTKNSYFTNDAKDIRARYKRWLKKNGVQ